METVYREGIPVAFIDWDAIQPVDPVVEVAAAAWAFVPLAPAEQLHQAGFDPLPDLAGRLRMFLDSYGLDDHEPRRAALVECKLFEIERIKYWYIRQ